MGKQNIQRDKVLDSVRSRKLRKRLEDLRTKKKFTQTVVAEKIGITRPSYNHLETGVNNPSIKTLWDLADLYDRSIDYIVGRSDYSNEETEKLGKPLGLSEKSIKGLLTIKASHSAEKADKNVSRTRLEVINYLLEKITDDSDIDYSYFNYLLNDVIDYIHVDFLTYTSDKTNDDMPFIGLHYYFGDRIPTVNSGIYVKSKESETFVATKQLYRYELEKQIIDFLEVMRKKVWDKECDKGSKPIVKTSNGGKKK